MTEVIPANYKGEVTIKIKMINPENNWGTVGFKIKTYEIIGEEEYLVDIIEGNELIPSLQCYAPCQYC
jgi:hypothetical protein